MGIYIPGMEMPKSCYKCYLKQRNGMDIACPVTHERFSVADINILEYRLDSCPLVPVPPHGRLIDADAESNKIKRTLSSEFIIRQNWSIDTVSLEFALKNMADAPTIIPASGKEGK